MLKQEGRGCAVGLEDLQVVHAKPGDIESFGWDSIFYIPEIQPIGG